MEHQILPFPIIFTFLLSLFAAIKIWKKTKTNKSNSKLPPGPWKLPLIGSMHHFVGSLPHRRLNDLAKKYGPLMHLQLGEVTNIVVSTPETAKEVLKTHDVSFAQRPRLLALSIVGYNFTDVAFAPYGDYWRHVRKICTLELLTMKRVQSFGSIREEEVSKMTKYLSSNTGSAINFTKMSSSLTYSIVSRAAFGKIWKGEEIFIPAVKDMMEAAGGFSLADLYPSVKFLQVYSSLRSKTESVHKRVDKVFQSIIDEHRARKIEKKSGVDGEEENFVDVLLNVQKQGNLEFPLTDDNIKAVIMDMFFAATETSSTFLVWAMAEMLRHPRVMIKAQAEVRQVFNKKGYVDEEGIRDLHYMKAIMKETLRFRPPFVLILPRECREKCVINGYDIPVKTRIIVNVWAIGRHPDYWTEPEKFYPERFLDSSIDYKGTNFEFLPFGAGRRICPGIFFGITNVELPLAKLLYHFDWKLPNGLNSENLDMTEDFGLVVSRKNDLNIIPVPYVPPSKQNKIL